MRGVIIAAGDGGRLRPYAGRTPKVLVHFRNQPLIWYPINAMALAGIEDIGVVVGHQADRIIESLMSWRPPGVRFEFINNPEFDGGNGVSVRAARQFVGTDEFVLSMGDHVFNADAVSRVASTDSSPAILAVDSLASTGDQLGDATKVFVDTDAYLIQIGKQLNHWNAVDIGVFRFQPSVFDAFDLLYERHGSELELTWVMRHLIAQPHGVTTCDINGLFWSDIDTEEDYYRANELFGIVADSDI